MNKIIIDERSTVVDKNTTGSLWKDQSDSEIYMLCKGFFDGVDKEQVFFISLHDGRLWRYSLGNFRGSLEFVAESATITLELGGE